MAMLVMVGASLCCQGYVFAETKDVELPQAWQTFKPILTSRLKQTNLKMKLEAKQVASFIQFLKHLNKPTPKLTSLDKILPKTTLELLMAVQARGVDLEEAENMAAYLEHLVHQFDFTHVETFDENTSHIIGRAWNEIDYTGEGMTWKKQQLKYQPYGILHFKSLDCLKKFFPVEAKLPYFNQAYQPRNPNPSLD